MGGSVALLIQIGWMRRSRSAVASLQRFIARRRCSKSKWKNLEGVG